MPPDPGTDAFIRLPDVDWFAVVIVEGIDAASGTPDLPSLGIRFTKEPLDLAANRRNIGRLSLRW